MKPMKTKVIDFANYIRLNLIILLDNYIYSLAYKLF